MILTFQRLDGTTHTTRENGIIVEDFTIDSPVPRTPTDILDGRSGFIDFGTVYEGRTLSAKFALIANDALDYTFLRNLWFRILDSREPFYLISSEEPGKRWLVKSGGFTPEKVLSNAGRFEVSFTSPSPYAESVGSTMFPVPEMIQANTNYGDPPIQYSFNSSQFNVWNDGDEIVDPRQHYLEIKFKGPSGNLSIKNVTTNDEWKYTGSTTVGDTLLLKGVRSTKNNISILGSTNKKLITIAPGFNQFLITGTTGPFEINFDFRFLYM
ncbi:MAG: phage tail family protein [Bacillota bacterium]